MPPESNRKLLDLFKRGLISTEELEATLAGGSRGESAAILSPSSMSDFPSLSEIPTMIPVGYACVPQVGDILAGIFQLVRPIGRGAMGVVWLADDLSGERQVCLKLLPAEVQNEKSERARVRAMFQKVHPLNHQHLCPLYLLGNDSAHGEFLVMKFIIGQTLSDYRHDFIAKHGEFPLSEVIRLLTPIAEVLDYVHAQGVIHRDVKPANIMVSDDGMNVFLVDLGLAAEVHGSMSRVSKSSRDVAGTAPYMAPEQWNGDPLDGRCDQYALAMVAWQLITGKLPFDVTNELAWMNCALNRIPERDAGLPGEQYAAILQSLSKSPASRFTNCMSFVRCLTDPNSIEEMKSQQPQQDVTTSFIACRERMASKSDLCGREPLADERIRWTAPITMIYRQGGIGFHHIGVIVVSSRRIIVSSEYKNNYEFDRIALRSVQIEMYERDQAGFIDFHLITISHRLPLRVPAKVFEMFRAEIRRLLDADA